MKTRLQVYKEGLFDEHWFEIGRMWVSIIEKGSNEICYQVAFWETKDPFCVELAHSRNYSGYFCPINCQINAGTLC